MTVLRWRRLPALGAGLLVLACGGGGGGGGMGPCLPGAATQLAKTSGDPAHWYFDNPLPSPLSVTARDANNCAVPGVAVNWSVGSSGGRVSPALSTTGSTGVATTTDSIGSTNQSVTATFTGLATPVTFAVSASAPPTTAPVSVDNNSFNPQEAVVKTGGTVTWTWNSGLVSHNVTYSSGPGSLPPNSPTQAGGTTFSSMFSSPFDNVGTYAYHCTIHIGMEGTVKVVH
jgi:plastocyanin